jgi:hypothetical protein
MDEQRELAIIRIPREIWWKILDEVIYDADSLIFSTNFEGEGWAELSDWYMLMLYGQRFQRFEKRRKIVGSVCRSWQAFAHSKRNLNVTLGPINHGSSPQGIDWPSGARSVTLSRGICDDIIETPALAQGLRWEIVGIDQTDALSLASIPLPRLRRLRMGNRGSYLRLDLNLLLDILSNFTNLTWLEYEADIMRNEPVPIDEDRSPVIMPNLQVLWYKNRATFQFPYSHLSLPSLRYLSLHIYEYPGRIPLLELLSCYRKTLRSFSARGWKRRGDEPIVHFPPWDDFPKLEELVLDGQWTAYFQPLPTNHPLRRIDAKHGSFLNVISLIEGANMREIISQRTYWTHEGDLAGDNRELMIYKVAVDHMLRKAGDRGVKFKVTLSGDRFLNRDEAIVAAAETGWV